VSAVTSEARSVLSVLCVIPARAGSRRIPSKNVREMLGRPMIAYTIEAAVQSGVFARVVVSTDGEAISEIARRAGAEVPFLRDAALADDHTPVSLATLDALDRLDPDGSLHPTVCQMMPNCPLRTAEDVRESAAAFRQSGAPAQISVVRYDWRNPWWAMRRAADGRLEPLFEARVTERSQDLPELFCPTGAIWWARAEVLRRERTFHVAGRTGWEIDAARGVDIDTPEDWALAEMLMDARVGRGAAHV
jgi:N-acylneuraminate cytidylyltransferase